MEKEEGARRRGKGGHRRENAKIRCDKQKRSLTSKLTGDLF